MVTHARPCAALLLAAGLLLALPTHAQAGQLSEPESEPSVELAGGFNVIPLSAVERHAHRVTTGRYCVGGFLLRFRRLGGIHKHLRLLQSGGLREHHGAWWCLRLNISPTASGLKLTRQGVGCSVLRTQAVAVT